MTRVARHPVGSRVHKRKSGRFYGIPIAATAVLAFITLSACSESDSKVPDATLDPANSASSPAASDSPSASPSSPSGEAAAVQLAYEGYWGEKLDAYAKASLEGTQFKKYAVAQAYSSAKNELSVLAREGYVAKGKPEISPQIDKVDTTKKTPRATFSDCVDISKWRLVSKSTGKEAKLPSGRLERYVSNVVAEKWYGKWVIVQVKNEDQGC